MITALRLGVLLVLFWAIGLSLGYPTLNRYQPSAPALADAAYYSEMVEKGVGEMRNVGHWRYRVLVPALARPIYLLVKDHSGSWDPRFLALLLVNAGFCAVTALTLAILGNAILGDPRLGLMASLLFLLNFNTTNFYLSGLVDSAEVCLITLVVAALHFRRWIWLPVLGLLGGAAKETFVGLSGLVAGGWWLSDLRTNGWRPGLFWSIGAMGLLGLAMVLALWSGLSGRLVLPTGVASSYLTDKSMIQRIQEIPAFFVSRGFWYTFAWLLPLAVAGWRRLPANWCWAGALAVSGALFMSVWAGAGENVGRPLFSAAGSIMIIAAAAGLDRLLGGKRHVAGH